MGDNSATVSASTRFQLSESLKKDAKGAVKTAAVCLGVAASMTQNVPYLGIISGALAEFLKIEDEVATLESDWKAVMSVAQQIKAIIDRVRAQCERIGAAGDAALPEGFLEPLMELERCIATALEALNACKAGSRRFRDRARVYLNRTDLSANVKQCRTDMQAALDLFNTRLHIINTVKLDEILSRGSTTRPDAAVPPIPISLPPPPAIFHGRAREIDHIVDLILSKPPARVAILGSGGIGKTSIALTVLHRPEIEERFGDRRFFMSCEAVSTGEGVLQELLKTFRFTTNAQSRMTPRDLLLSHLRTLPRGMLCLDNLETPWNTDASGVESLLIDIASLSHLTLLVTTRGGVRPRGVAWTQPFLPEIKPLTLEAALDTWDTICGSHDRYSKLLVKAVDLVPLVVIHLAQLALTETSEVLWDRWKLEQTRLLQSTGGPQHRLNGVERPIMLSLTGPILRDKEGVLDFFSVLCTLPQGLPESRIPAFVDAYASLLPDIRRSITILKQCSLAYTAENRSLRVLSPIRHYMQIHHPCSDASFAILTNIYCSLIESCPWAENSCMVCARASIQPELINIPAILELSLSRRIVSKLSLPWKTLFGPSLHGKTHHIRRMLNAVIHFSSICDTLYAYNTTIVRRALVHAKRDAPEFEAPLWASIGGTLLCQQNYGEALSALSKALELYRRAGVQAGEANNLCSLGELYQCTRKHEEAEKFLRSALRIYTELDMPRGRARALWGLGKVYYQARNRSGESEHMLKDALDIYERIGDKRGKADVLFSLGHLDLLRGRLEDAKTALTTALDLYNKIDCPLGKVDAMKDLGRVYTQLQCEEEAEAMLQSTLDIYRQLNNTLGQADSFHGLGQLYMRQKLYDKAVHALQTAVKLYGNIGERRGKANSFLELGRTYLELARLDEAERPLESALALYHDLHDRRWESMTLLDLGDLRRLQHRYEEACNMLQSAHNVAVKVAGLRTQGVALDVLGRVRQECGELEAAQTCFKNAIQVFESAKCSEDADIARKNLEALRLERQSIEGQDTLSQGVATTELSEAQEGPVLSKGG